MTTVRELVTVFGFEPDSRGLDKIEGVIGGLKTSFLAVSAAAAAGAATLYGLTASVAAYGDATIKTAQRVGLTADAFQQLDFALNISGTSMADQRGSFVRLARTANDAANGIKEYEKVYEQLGVSVTDSNGDLKSTEQLILDVSDAFQAMPIGIEKTALAADLFGRRGTDMLQFLSLGSAGIRELMDEASALGGVMSEDATRQSEVFVDTLHRLKTSVHGVKLAIGTELMPVVTETVQSMLEWVQANKGMLAQKLDKFLKGVTTGVKLFGKSLFWLFGVIDIVVQSLNGMRQIISWVAFALTVLAINTIRAAVLPALISLVTSITAAGVATSLLTAATWLWNAAIAAIPLAITAIIVLVGIMIDDFRRFMDGQDSLIGRLIDKYSEATSGIAGMFSGVLRTLRDLRDQGALAMTMLASDVEFSVQRITSFFTRMGLRVKLVFNDLQEGARDALDLLGKIPGIGGDRTDVQERADENITNQLTNQIRAEEERMRLAVSSRGRDRQLIAEEATLRRQERLSQQAAQATSVDVASTVNAEITINEASDAESVSEQVQAGIASETARQNRGLLRSLGIPASFGGE